MDLPLHAILELNCPEPKKGVKYLFDEYPESILVANDLGKRPVDLARRTDLYGKHCGKDIAAFLEAQTKYCLDAKSLDKLTTRDENGRFLLHRALLDDDVSLGTIKFILKGYPDAIGLQDNNGMLPVHLACRLNKGGIFRYDFQQNSSSVLQFLVEQDQSALEIRDAAGDSLLHHVCKHGNSDAVLYLVEQCPSLVSSENDAGVLPVHLLSAKAGKFSVEHTEAIWRLLVAHPATVASALVSGSASAGEEKDWGTREK